MRVIVRARLKDGRVMDIGWSHFEDDFRLKLDDLPENTDEIVITVGDYQVLDEDDGYMD